jgi:hypothetical protein
MREFVGIKPPLDLLLEVFSKGLPVNSVFKRETLMFRRVGCIPQFGTLSSLLLGLGNLGSTIPSELARHLDYLSGQGLLFDVPPSAQGPQLDVLASDKEFQSPHEH